VSLALVEPEALSDEIAIYEQTRYAAFRGYHSGSAPIRNRSRRAGVFSGFRRTAAHFNSWRTS
jgi:hypothetical protein